MKIVESFIPFILSGKKKFEFRVKQSNQEGTYKIKNQVFKLEHKETTHADNVSLLEHNYEYFFVIHPNFPSSISQLKCYNITIQEYTWIKKKWETYFQGNNIEIYAWKNLNVSTLQVVKDITYNDETSSKSQATTTLKK